MVNSISNHTMKDFLRGCKLMNYGSMMYLYGWMMDKHQPIDIDHQQIWDEYCIEDSMMQHYLKLMKIIKTNQYFGITLSPKQSLHTTTWLTVQQDFLIRYLWINLIRSTRQLLTRQNERNSLRKKIWWWCIWVEKYPSWKSPYQAAISRLKLKDEFLWKRHWCSKQNNNRAISYRQSTSTIDRPL